MQLSQQVSVRVTLISHNLIKANLKMVFQLPFIKALALLMVI